MTSLPQMPECTQVGIMRADETYHPVEVSLQKVPSIPKILTASISEAHKSEEKEAELHELSGSDPSNKKEGDIEASSRRISQTSMARRRKRSSSNLSDNDDEEPSNSSTASPQRCPTRKKLEQWLYIGSSAIIGSTLRTYMARLYGEDCEEGANAVQDFLTPLSKHVCVTAGGGTIQTGGALFRDLPACLLGSFFLGILTSHRHPIRYPWFHKDHPIQTNEVFHSGLGVGLCGSLTTFASWNTQMVVMMDGSYTELGPQVIPALFGYLLGIIGNIATFKFGREVSYWMYCRTHKIRAGETNIDSDAGDHDASLYSNNHPLPTSSQQIKEKTPPEDAPIRHFRLCLRPLCLLLFVVLITFALVLVADHVYDIPFYKNLIITILLAPFGAISRWKMSAWNGNHHPRLFSWVPWGTLLANSVGAIISIVCRGLLDRYSDSSFLSGNWTQALVVAIKVGYAGSLSTVSSMVKEIVAMQEIYPGQAKPLFYGAGTCFVGMLLGLTMYMMIVRIDT